MVMKRTLSPLLILALPLAATAACGNSPTPSTDPVPGGDSIVASDTVGVWQTNATGAQLLSQQPRLRFVTTTLSAPYTIRIDEGTHYQSIVGFGAAFTDASTYLIQEKMSAAQRRALLTDLFGTDGLGLAFMRMTMGSSDFSRSHWSYDDVPPGQTDPTLSHFSIDRDREAMLPVILAAREINPHLVLMASPWSAPGWMKTTGSLVKGRLREDAYDPYAHYFLRFLQAYAAAGVPVQYLSVQNEPDFEPDNYPGMRMSATERAAFVGGHLGPLLRTSGMQTAILDWDHNWDQPQQPLTFLADSAARSFTTGVAWHCYGGNVSAQSAVHDAYPEMETFFTECSGGEWSPDFGNNLAFTVGTLIIDGTRNWARGVALWNLALDPAHGPHTGGCGDCRGVVTIDPATGVVTHNVEYFALAHASRFVRPGARRVSSDSDVGGLKSVAFRNPDGSTALIVLNTADVERTFAVRAASRAFAYSLPAGAVATFRWEGRARE
jgi:glucosylceramidase